MKTSHEYNEQKLELENEIQSLQVKYDEYKTQFEAAFEHIIDIIGRTLGIVADQLTRKPNDDGVKVGCGQLTSLADSYKDAAGSIYTSKTPVARVDTASIGPRDQLFSLLYNSSKSLLDSSLDKLNIAATHLSDAEFQLSRAEAEFDKIPYKCEEDQRFDKYRSTLFSTHKTNGNKRSAEEDDCNPVYPHDHLYGENGL